MRLQQKIDLISFKGEVLTTLRIKKEDIENGSGSNPLLEHSFPKEFEIKNVKGETIFLGSTEDLIKSEGEVRKQLKNKEAGTKGFQSMKKPNYLLKLTLEFRNSSVFIYLHLLNNL